MCELLKYVDARQRQRELPRLYGILAVCLLVGTVILVAAITGNLGGRYDRIGGLPTASHRSGLITGIAVACICAWGGTRQVRAKATARWICKLQSSHRSPAPVGSPIAPHLPEAGIPLVMRLQPHGLEIEAAGKQLGTSTLSFTDLTSIEATPRKNGQVSGIVIHHVGGATYVFTGRLSPQFVTVLRRTLGQPSYLAVSP
jgi:hypothetical protein